MSQLRLNPLTGRWVTIATDRNTRPDDFSHERLAVETGPHGPCPFCPGNEEETPPAVETYDEGGEWQIRIVPNRFPAFSGSEPMTVRNLGPVFNQAPASGSHEVFVFSRDHGKEWSDLEDDQAAQVMYALRDRFEEHGRSRSIRYTQAIVNFGREAGASLLHPHGQLLGMPFVPGEIAEEEAGFRRFAGSCVMCTTAEAERDAGSRVVVDEDGVLVMCPFWSGTPYEMLLVHDQHEGHLARSSPEVLAAVGRAIKRSLALLKKNVGDVAYNLVIHTLPHHHEDEFHWHVHLLPRLQSVGGFEQGTGVPINIVSPEHAAKTLVGG
jgi:UDPglucose--hexose-1-phosphate uridylyltransferase